MDVGKNVRTVHVLEIQNWSGIETQIDLYNLILEMRSVFYIWSVYHVSVLLFYIFRKKERR